MSIFCVDVTFEMRTVLNGIKLSDSIFILNGDGGEESRIAERQREREKMCERQRVTENGR